MLPGHRCKVHREPLKRPTRTQEVRHGATVVTATDVQVAVHTLQSYAVAVLEHTVAPPPLPTPAQRTLMQKLADDSAARFQQTIYHSAGGVFAKYFHTASPSAALAQMNLGSRPAKRKAQGGIETLRAIPWVFA